MDQIAAFFTNILGINLTEKASSFLSNTSGYSLLIILALVIVIVGILKKLLKFGIKVLILIGILAFLILSGSYVYILNFIMGL